MATKPMNTHRLDQLVIDARRQADDRQKGYREQALKLYPWICGRCSREFDRSNLIQLTVHHRNHNHDDNPSDGSNWELLCLYCHDNEHQKQLEASSGLGGGKSSAAASATFQPFAHLKDLLQKK